MDDTMTLADPAMKFCNGQELWENRYSASGELIGEEKLKDCFFGCRQTEEGGSCITYPREGEDFIILDQTIETEAGPARLTLRYRPLNALEAFIDAIISIGNAIFGESASIPKGTTFRFDGVNTISTCQNGLVTLVATDQSTRGTLTIFSDRHDFLPAGSHGLGANVPTTPSFWSVGHRYELAYRIECFLHSHADFATVIISESGIPPGPICSSNADCGFGRFCDNGACRDGIEIMSGRVSTTAGAPLEGVKVSAVKSLIGVFVNATTNGNGNYSLEVPVPDTYVVHADKTGFASFLGLLAIGLDEKVRGADITLLTDKEGLWDIIVSKPVCMVDCLIDKFGFVEVACTPFFASCYLKQPASCVLMRLCAGVSGALCVDECDLI